MKETVTTRNTHTSHSAHEGIISCEDVSFSYDGGATWALDHVSLTVHEGERVVIVGPNGSGKSTLARVLAGLSAPDGGTVQLVGQRVYDSDGAHPDAYRAAQRHIGAVFQRPEDQIVTTVVEDDVAFGPENLNLDHESIGERVHSALAAVGMEHMRQADPTQLSGGEQQRVAIAGMLAMHSRVLVLDEPTAMLDPDARADVLRTLDSIQEQGITLVIISHLKDEWAHADRVIAMDHGRITQSFSDNNQKAEPLQGTIAEAQPYAGFSVDSTHLSEGLGRKDALSFQHISFRYADARTPAIDDLNLTIEAGSTVAIMGRNGSGKTTFARLMNALETPDNGSITVDGVSVARASRRKAGRSNGASRKERKELRRHLGYVMQHPERQLFAQTVEEDIAFGPKNQGLSEAEVAQRVTHAMQRLHIEHLRHRSPYELSGGQQRLAAIAGVLATNPRVLLMDEPTAALDMDSTARIVSLIQELHNEGVTVLVITHDPQFAVAIADQVVSFGEPARAAERTLARAGLPVSVVNRTSAEKPAKTAAESTTNEHFSPLASLDPRAKIVGFLVLMFTAFAMNSWPQLALGAAVTVGLTLASRVSFLQLFKSVRVFFAMFAMVAVLNLLVVHSGSVLWRLGSFTLTTGGVNTAAIYLLRFTMVITLGAVLLLCTTPTNLTDAFESLLSPLKRFHWHVQELALVLSLALRFLPSLAKETQSIRDAQATRGGTIDSGSFGVRVRALCAIVVPVFAAAIRHADILSLALEARCYEEGITRSHWRPLDFRARDAVFLGLILLVCAGLVAMHVCGV